MPASGDDPQRRRSTDGILDNIQSAREESREQHRRTNDRIDRGFAKVDADMAALRRELLEHRRDDDAVADRVLIMETQREDKNSQALRRSTIISLLVATGTSSILWVANHVWPKG